MLRFEEPHAALQASYRELVREFSEAGEPLIPFPLAFPNEDFSLFLARLADAREGRGLPPGSSPTPPTGWSGTTSWWRCRTSGTS